MTRSIFTRSVFKGTVVGASLETALAKPIDITSKIIDTHDRHALSGQFIRRRGEFRRLILTPDESILALEVKEVLTPSNPGINPWPEALGLLFKGFLPVSLAARVSMLSLNGKLW